MYLLTKNLYLDFALREKIFHELLRENYSNESIKKYKPMLLGLVFSKTNEKYNIGTCLKNLLTALYLKGCFYDYEIIATINGTGFSKLNFEKLEYFIARSVIDSLESAFNKTVFIDIKIKNSQIKITIKYQGKIKPEFYSYFKIIKRFKKVALVYNFKYEQCSSGKEKHIYDFLCDRLSPTNLAFID